LLSELRRGFRIDRRRIGGGTLDMSIAAWVICSLLFWVVAFPCYLVARGRYQSMRSAGSYGVMPAAAAPVPAYQFG
jgi:hypothetical protein